MDENNEYNQIVGKCRFKIVENSGWNDYGYKTEFIISFENKNLDSMYVKVLTPSVPYDKKGNWIYDYLENDKKIFNSGEEGRKKQDPIVFIGSNLSYYKELYYLIDQGYITIGNYKTYLEMHNLVDLFFNYQKVLDKHFNKDAILAISTSLLRLYGFESYSEYTNLLNQLQYIMGNNVQFDFRDFFDQDKFIKDINDELFGNKNIYFLDEFIQKMSYSDEFSTRIYSWVVDYLLDDQKKHSSNKDKQLINNWPIIDVLYFRLENKDKIAKVDKLLPEKFVNIIKDVYEIKNNLRVDPNNLSDDCLCQYTGINSIKYLINNNKLTNTLDGSNTSPAVLRLTNSNQMNDPLEGKVLLDYFKKLIQNNNSKDEDESKEDYVPSNAFISSASGSINKLSLWQEYADNAKGVCLIYDSEFLKEKLLKYESSKYQSSNSKSANVQSPKGQKIDLYRMVYLKPIKNDKTDPFKITLSKLKNETSKENDVLKKKITGSITKLVNDFKILQGYANASSNKNYLKMALTCISTISYLFKRDDYKDENEFRIMTTLYLQDPQIVNDFNSQNNVLMLRTYTKDYDGNLIKVKYSKVLLGPKAPDIDYIAPYIKNVDPSIVVKKTDIRFR